ncbi:MAG: oligopeptidase A [Aquificaceae bacterium]|nr:MAG: oligopeptidase A [Aquificaceae bacterium]
MSNHLPEFSKVDPSTTQTSIKQLITKNKKLSKSLLSSSTDYNWDNLMQPLSMADDALQKLWSPVSHLNSVVNTPELRDAYTACVPLISDYHTAMGQDRDLFKAIQSIQENQEALGLDDAQKKVIENALKSFHLSGVSLSKKKQHLFREINKKLSELSSAFADNVLDATNAWTKQIDDVTQLAGLSDANLDMMKQAAEQRDQEGYLLTLEFPSYIAVTTYADDRALREEVYHAFVTRAAENSSHPEFDNSELMEDILQLRQEKAKLLDFSNFAALSLDKKMAESAEEVIGFLDQLADKSYPFAIKEIEALKDFAQKEYGIDDLQPWDLAYVSEKLKLKLFDFGEEDLKPYFPVEQVIKGLFELVEKLYRVTIKQKQGVDTWHEDVRFYEIFNAQGELQAQFYFDLYARQHKRGGAWMDDYCGRFKYADKLQTPVAYMTCNSASASGDKPALMTHNEVITLFHEFGHGLHHMLTQVDYLDVSGINGVEWDAVELPSQFMENWCWQKETLDMFAAHYESGKKLPDDLFDKMQAARHFQSAMLMVRQLEFSLFDMKIHQDTTIKSAQQIQQVLDAVRKKVAIIKANDFNRFQNSFSHIFAGGYAAGYYSYKWAEVLSADAFARFEEEGIFNAEVSQDFLSEILTKGGSRPAMASFIAFRGRKPTVDALLRHAGLAEEAAA